MRFMVLALASGDIVGAVTRTRKQAESWLRTMAEAHELAAWRYHDGSGWADGSTGAWKYIQDLPTSVMVVVGEV